MVSTNGFNPRTRESATLAGFLPAGVAKVSIHALVRVRLYQLALSGYNIGFNPRTRESATILYWFPSS